MTNPEHLQERQRYKTLSAWIADLEDDGWVEGGLTEEDLYVCQNTPCDDCGRPFTDGIAMRAADEYRAFWYCPECGGFDEF